MLAPQLYMCLEACVRKWNEKRLRGSGREMFALEFQNCCEREERNRFCVKEKKGRDMARDDLRLGKRYPESYETKVK